ncbi:hypothetical protein CHARACLAT_028786 [Characodon lateralis]|uniref:Uncharacterized protein n=1 Tax=Characodon lateralis TaxID=208331 RepID=A0ABU7CS54_9TELE|nr:hypothetical protein [Characodon lateralis]
MCSLSYFRLENWLRVLDEITKGATTKLEKEAKRREEAAALAPKERTKKLRYKARLNYLPFWHYVYWR